MGMTGLRHVALNVRDPQASKRFYADCFGMRVVWEPDPDNVYMSSGPDNLAPLSALPSMAGLGAEQTIMVQLDGRTIARSSMRNMPREWRMVGV